MASVERSGRRLKGFTHHIYCINNSAEEDEGISFSPFNPPSSVTTMVSPSLLLVLSNRPS